MITRNDINSKVTRYKYFKVVIAHNYHLIFEQSLNAHKLILINFWAITTLKYLQSTQLPLVKLQVSNDHS